MPTDDDSIVFYNRAGRGFSKREVRLRAKKIRSEVAGGRAFTCLLTDDRELRRLNREFLDQDYATDVLSFPSGDSPLPEPMSALPHRENAGARAPSPEGRGYFHGRAAEAPLGEMAISVDRAREQAAGREHSLEQEIGVLMLHGLLHLLGLDHERDRGKMAQTERQWRKTLGLPAGLIERVRP